MTKDEEWVLAEKYDGIETIPAFHTDRARLKQGEPVAYVIGWQPFLGLKIWLDSHPLIPRPETEWWTEELIQKIGARECRVLDLCAGSGAIGCAVLKNCPNAHVSFGEIDPAHEATIQKNITENRLDTSRAEICIGNLFAPFGDEKFDFIAVNPPYIPSGCELEKSVADFEPARALFSGSDGLDLIRRIIAELPERLDATGRAWIECDRDNADVARGLAETAGMTTEIRNDQYDVPRLVVVKN